MVSPDIDAYLGNDRYCADLYGARSPCVGVRRPAQLFWHRSFSFDPLSPSSVPYNSHSTIRHIITRAEDRSDEDLESLAGSGTRTGCIRPGGIVCFETEKGILSRKWLPLLSCRTPVMVKITLRPNSNLHGVSGLDSIPSDPEPISRRVDALARVFHDESSSTPA